MLTQEKPRKYRTRLCSEEGPTPKNFCSAHSDIACMHGCVRCLAHSRYSLHAWLCEVFGSFSIQPACMAV